MVLISSWLAALPVAFAAQSFNFKAPSKSPSQQSNKYVGKSNTTLPLMKQVKGLAFDRVIFITMENTNFDVSASSPIFQTLARGGITMTNYYSCGHPSEPNYVCQAGGDTFGMGDDDFHQIPSNISTIVDLLEQKNIGWVTYQENMPTDGFEGFNFASKNYVNTSAPDYLFYMRKHNPFIIYDSIVQVPARKARVRNMNDFAADLVADRLPQYVYITPNMMNDGHDTNIDFQSAWLNYFLVPLMDDPRFNGPKTVIVLTYDENGTGSINNQIFTMVIGNGVPKSLRGSFDSTFYSHYSELSTVQVNWGLGCLGRQDTNKTMANVYDFVAQAAGYKNTKVKDIPLLNGTSATPGPFNLRPGMNTEFPHPNLNAKCAGGGEVCVMAGCPGIALPERLTG